MTTLVSAIEAIEKAMEGVTPGRWGQFHPSYSIEAIGAPFSEWDTSHDISAIVDGKRIKRVATFKHAADAAYLDACSPDRMREVLALAREAEALKRENAEKDARIAALEEGLMPFSLASEEIDTLPDGYPWRDEQHITRGIKIGDLRVARGLTRRPFSACRHNRLNYDPKERRIWCRDCETDVDACDAFVILVEAFEGAWKKLLRRESALADAEQFQIRSIAAKTIDEAWRSRKMVPACPSCGNGLFPEDFRKRPTMLGKDFAGARRAKRGGTDGQ